jgi:hypothetical protein
MRGNDIEQAIGNAIGIGVEEAQPLEVRDGGEAVEELREPVFDAEVFAVASCVLTDEGELANAGGDQALGFGDDRFETAGAKLAAELRDDAEAAGMVASLSDLDVGRGAGSGENARRLVVIEVGG